VRKKTDMDDPLDIPQNTPEATPPENVPETGAAQNQNLASGTAAELGFVHEPAQTSPPPTSSHEEVESGRRSFRRNLAFLLSLSLAAFILTAWILVRVDTPFAMFSTGPQDIARAQLRALDRGELRPAYNMFSARYRKEVSFDVWHELVITHWRMFHVEVLRAGPPAQKGPRVTLELHLRGADDNEYRARYTLIRLQGRWWIDDVHWAEEPDESDISRT
jgi:Domain of unknown function (DUF4864)